MRPVAYIAGGAAIMLFVIFLLAVGHRRRIRRRFSNLRLITRSGCRSMTKASR
jgi:hypothetical protein